MPGDFKGTVFRKNQMAGYVLARTNSSKFLLFDYL